MSTFHEQLARFVRDERKANRLTQTDLAQLAGVGRRFVSELERGKPGLRLQKVDDVLRVFGRRLGVVPRRSGAGEESVGGDRQSGAGLQDASGADDGGN